MRIRTAAALSALVLLATSCGARLTTEQRAAALSGSGIAGGGREAANLESASDTLGETGALEGGGGAAAGGGGGAAAAGRSGGGLPGAPEGGNGGATDKGVTGSQIVIANLSDVSGPSPGLFRTAQQAMAALTEYVNSEGGIYGRKLKLMLIDSKTDAGANHAGALDACDKAFALVGSMSAFDDGGAKAIDECGIPDLSAIPVNAARQLAKNTYGAFPNRPDYLALAPANYIKEKYPEAIKRAAMIWINGAVTRAQAQRVMEMNESIGFDYIYTAETQVVEPNYCPYVVAMARENVQYVTTVSDYQSIVGLMRAIKQCGGGWSPQVKDWNSVVYSPGFLKLGGSDVEGSLVYLNTTLFEEQASNAEMQLYLRWLNKVAPGAQPDYFGLYAWSAGRMFLEAAKAAGPRLTRAALLDQLKKMSRWDGHGLHVAHDVANKMPSNCIAYLKVGGGKFVREDPKSPGFFCNRGGMYKVSRIY